MSDINYLHQLRAVVFCVDGVFTDGRNSSYSNGMKRKHFSVRDTMGIRALRKAGIYVFVVASELDLEVRQHMKFIGVDEIHEGSGDKRQYIKKVSFIYGLGLKEVALMSHDIHDQSLMAEVGLGITVRSAERNLQESAHMTTGNFGGEGAVLEASGVILRAIRIKSRYPASATSSTNQKAASA